MCIFPFLLRPLFSAPSSNRCIIRDEHGKYAWTAYREQETPRSRVATTAEEQQREQQQQEQQQQEDVGLDDTKEEEAKVWSPDPIVEALKHANYLLASCDRNPLKLEAKEKEANEENEANEEKEEEKSTTGWMEMLLLEQEKCEEEDAAIGKRNSSRRRRRTSVDKCVRLPTTVNSGGGLDPQSLWSPSPFSSSSF